MEVSRQLYALVELPAAQIFYADTRRKIRKIRPSPPSTPNFGSCYKQCLDCHWRDFLLRYHLLLFAIKIMFSVSRDHSMARPRFANGVDDDSR